MRHSLARGARTYLLKDISDLGAVSCSRPGRARVTRDFGLRMHGARRATSFANTSAGRSCHTHRPADAADVQAKRMRIVDGTSARGSVFSSCLVGRRAAAAFAEARAQLRTLRIVRRDSPRRFASTLNRTPAKSHNTRTNTHMFELDVQILAQALAWNQCDRHGASRPNSSDSLGIPGATEVISERRARTDEKWGRVKTTPVSPLLMTPSSAMFGHGGIHQIIL